MNVDRIIGRVRQQRGKSAEGLAELSVNQAMGSDRVPRWLKGIENTNRREDARGIDRWVVTDVGKIRLQIKSSRKSADLFKLAHPNIPVVVIKQGDDPGIIFSRILTVVGEQRRIYLDKRRRT